jgi:hypothetical protein
VAADRADAVRTAIFAQTSTIGLRESRIGKTALERRMRGVEVDGQPIRVKLALRAGVVVNVQPEYDDVVRAAQRTGRPAKDVLTDAVTAAGHLTLEH